MLPTGLPHDTSQRADVDVFFRMHDRDAMAWLERMNELVVAPGDAGKHPPLAMQPLDHLPTLHRRELNHTNSNGHP